MRVDARPLPLSPPPANDAAQIDKVARQMEGLFAQMMIKQMRETALGDTMFPGAAGQFRELYDEQIAKSLTEGKGLGLSTMIARQLSRQAGGGADDAVQALPLSMPKAGSAPMLPLDTYLRPLAAKPLARDAAAPLPSAPTGASTPALAASNTPARPNWIAAADVPRMMPAVRASAATEPAPSATAGPGNARVDAFVAKVWPHAQKIGRELGVDPRAIVAQTALETGWGRSTISANGQTANNYFGIKATGGWRGGSVATATQEFANGGFRTERAAFRAYDGVEQSFNDYAALLKRSPRYAGALNAGDDIRGFAAALQRGGYATDPAYARKIEAIATGPALNRALARLDIDDATGPTAPSARNLMFAASGMGAF
ncbi:flagellar assembly peptidoglycan hydrolase FlgJ [Silanimonas sp.]|jgi:flagellar protein FlgJ|uniref:flagellar assembly peptidoglycan hydrolase FlgJ n=1 Tax=Silanimonas sp. TaxID=1929290 RepID=UPI0022C4A45A|nr:flagellar assembly peptidoglycan hydrolase FlgJ [Silanimonas sp.]MCZ8062140.1 flagellar assembly peptidoglycan hydrolase FlgJ [Silanimonas sp.]